MQFIFKGKINSEEFMLLVFESLSRQCNSKDLYNPSLIVKSLNDDGNIIDIFDPITCEPIIIHLNDYIKKKDDIPKIELQHLTHKNLEVKFDTKSLERLDKLITEGFSIDDICYLFDLYNESPTQYFLLKNYTDNVTSNLAQRQKAWEKYKKDFQQAGKNIFFENDILPLDYVLVPIDRKNSNFFYKRKFGKINNNFKSKPVGCFTNEEILVFSLKIESEERQLPLMNIEEIKSPLCVLPYFEPNLSNYIHIQKNPEKYDSVGLYWDEKEKDIFEVKKITLPTNKYPKLKLYNFNTSPFVRLSLVGFPKKLINRVEYRMGYEIGINILEIIVDVKRFMLNNNWFHYYKKEIPSGLIPHNKLNLINYLDFKQSLEIRGIDEDYNPYYQFNALKFNIPLINKDNINLRNSLKIGLYDLKHLDTICNNLNRDKPYPIAYDSENNIFFFEVFEDIILAAWNDFLQSNSKQN